MKITYYVAASIDGFIARKNGSVDWLDQFNDSGEDYGYQAFYDSVDALIMGRSTYEQILTFGDWPYSGKPAFVLSSRSLEHGKPDVFPATDLNQLGKQLEAEGFERVWLTGGGQTASALLKNGLLDEMIVSYMPIALGTGIPLFAQPAKESEMEICDQTSYKSGVVQITYRLKS